MAEFASLETDRLVLRPPEGSDLAVLEEMHSDPEVMRYLIVIGTSGGVQAAWRTLALQLGHWHLLGYGQWIVLEKGTGQVVGRVGLWNPPGRPGLEVSWMIRRSRWGQGFATEAARAAVRYAFETVGADRVISVIRPDNVRALRVAAKVGETFERIDQIDAIEHHVYGLGRQSYERLRSA